MPTDVGARWLKRQNGDRGYGVACVPRSVTSYAFSIFVVEQLCRFGSMGGVATVARSILTLKSRDREVQYNMRTVPC